MTAFRAVYADWKLIKTRSVVQVVFELPVEQADAAYEVLGGMPVAAKERWFGIAAIRNPEASPGASVPQPDPVEQPQPDRAKRDWRDMQPSQQAALRCNDPTFRAFMKEKHGLVSISGAGAAEAIRLFCEVPSRSVLDTDQRARVIWKQLDDQFQAWSRVGA
jgi:hypothetical protein